MKLVFSNHAEQRIIKRKITKEEVVETIMHPDITLKKHGKYYAQKRTQRGLIEVVYERTEKHIKIITLYWL